MMENFVKLAKYRYECGNYSVSTSYLYFYMLIMSPVDKVFNKSLVHYEINIHSFMYIHEKYVSLICRTI